MIYFSIVLATYGRQKKIFKVINYLNDQNFFNFELIIIDQSKINIKKKIDNLKNKTFNLKYIHLSEPNVSYARNLGVKNSKYQYIFFLDDDIHIKDKNFFKRLSLYLKKNKNTKIIQGQMIEKGIKKMKFFNKGDRSKEYNKEVESISVLVGGNCTIEKKTFLAVKGFNQLYEGRTFGYEDGDLGKRLIKKGFRIKFVPDFLVFHENYQKGGNRDNDKTKNSKINLTDRLITFFQYHGEHFHGFKKYVKYFFVYQKILKKDFLNYWSFIIIPYSILSAYIISKSRRKKIFRSIF